MSILPKITATGIAKATASASYDCARFAVTGSYEGIKNTAGRVGSTSLGVIQHAGSFFTCGKKASSSPEVPVSEPKQASKPPSFEVLREPVTELELSKAKVKALANVLSPRTNSPFSLENRSLSAPLLPPKALSHSASAPAKLSSIKGEAENSLDQFLQVTGLPENVQNVFKTSLIPPGSLRKCEFGNGSFTLQLDKDYEGKVEGVDPKKGMSMLNKAKVFISQKIAGNYDPATRSIISLKGLSVGYSKILSKGLDGFGMKADITPESEMFVNVGVINKDCSVSEFQNTFSSEYLKWKQE